MALTVTRRLNESIKIGDDVTVEVVRIRGNQIQLKVSAPRETRILRTELKADERNPNADDAI